jgi:hypothetical protein
LDCIHLAEDRDRGVFLQNTVVNFRVPLRALNILANSETISFPRRALFHVVGNPIFGMKLGNTLHQVIYDFLYYCGLI